MIDQLLETPRPYRGQIVRLEQPPNQQSAVLDLLVMRRDRPGADARRWRIQARGVLEFRILSHEVESVALLERHPLLWTYDQEELELYFHGQPRDVHATIGRLLGAHASAGRGWISFDALFNEEMPLQDLLTSGSGLLARGPVPVIRAYQEILEADGLRCSVSNQGSMAIDGVENPRALILGRSYVVATDFSAELVDHVDTTT